MKFVILVTAPPYSHQGSLSAYHFCHTALELGHEITQVFFYRDGIHNANQFHTAASDEINLVALWQNLATQYHIELIACVSAAQRRGILDDNEAKQQQKTQGNLADGFKISGLGQFMMALYHADRMVQFN